MLREAIIRACGSTDGSTDDDAGDRADPGAHDVAAMPAVASQLGGVTMRPASKLVTELAFNTVPC